MAVHPLDVKQSSAVFTAEVRAERDASLAFASLMQASLNDGSLAQVASAMASSVYASAHATLARLKGVTLEPEALSEGRKAVQVMHGALQSMVEYRSAFWSAYQEREVPKNVEWLPPPSGMIDELAAELAKKAKDHPVAWRVQSEKIMFANPKEDGATVFERWKAAAQQAELGGPVAGMKRELETFLGEAETASKAAAALKQNPEGRDTATLIADLKEAAHAKYAPDEVPPTAYIGLGVESLVHPREMERLLIYAGRELRDHHQTAPASFRGNVIYQMGLGVNLPGTTDAWHAALKTMMAELGG